jgi:hypothetical protein
MAGVDSLEAEIGVIQMDKLGIIFNPLHLIFDVSTFGNA